MRPLLVFVGPSGVGKSTLVRKLVAGGLINLLPTWTTRSRRPDEMEGVSEHIFASDEAFDRAIETGEIIDALPLFGLPYRYGLPRLETSARGPIETLMCRAHLLDRLSLHIQDFLVYQIEASPQVARSRLKEREAEGTELGDRWETFNEELELGRRMAHRRFANNGSIDLPYDQLTRALAEDYP